jgi:hypothetical protein
MLLEIALSQTLADEVESVSLSPNPWTERLALVTLGLYNVIKFKVHVLKIKTIEQCFSSFFSMTA